MKAKHIRLIRAKFNNIKWVEKRYKRLCDLDRELNDFRLFECSDFFRGEATANKNRELYKIKYRKNCARLNYLEKHINKLKQSE